MRLSGHMHDDEPGTSLPSDVAEAARISLRSAEGPLDVAPGVMISFWTSVYERGYQLRAAMGPNLAHLRRHHGYVRWIVVLCKDDYAGRPREDLDLSAWVQEHYGAFMNAGLLALFRAEPDADGGASHACRSKKHLSRRGDQGAPRRHKWAELGG